MPKLEYSITVALVEWMNADNENDASNWLVYLIPRGKKRYCFVLSVLHQRHKGPVFASEAKTTAATGASFLRPMQTNHESLVTSPSKLAFAFYS